MADFKAIKWVATLPEPLVEDMVYMVRVGDGFDLYVSDQTGSIAHRLNADSAIGNLANLTTTDKLSLVSAINELQKKLSVIKPRPTTWVFTQSSVFSGTQAATQFNLQKSTGVFPSGCFTQKSEANQYIQAEFPSITHVTMVRLRASASNGGWGADFLNGAKLQRSVDGSEWVDIATIAGHVTDETAYREYSISQMAKYIRIVKTNNWLAIGQMTIF